MLDKFEDLYYSIVPYEFRYYVLLQKLKNYWRAYTTIKPRTLSKFQYTDAVELIPHCLFEILCRFVEQELSKNRIDWEGSAHTIETKTGTRNVYDVWMDLYRWWNERYIPYHDKCFERWHEFKEIHSRHEDIEMEDETFGTLYEWKTIWDSPENEEESNRLFRVCSDIEQTLYEELQEHMRLIVESRVYMWT